MDSAAIAFGRTAGRGWSEVESGLALLGEPAACFAAGLGFAIELLSDRSRPARVAESQHLDFKVAALCFDGEPVTGPDLAGGTRGLMVGLNAVQLTGFGGEGPGLEEAGGPKPLVESNADHGNSVLRKAS